MKVGLTFEILLPPSCVPNFLDFIMTTVATNLTDYPMYNSDSVSPKFDIKQKTPYTLRVVQMRSANMRWLLCTIKSFKK